MLQCVTLPDRWSASRGELPVLQIKEGLVGALEAHDVAVVCGDTGCGKTTQVLQAMSAMPMLLEQMDPSARFACVSTYMAT